jgi:predicted P-loop ATPase
LLLKTHQNFALFLEHAEEWCGVLAFNQFDAGHYVLAPPPAPITAKVGQELDDSFDVEATCWFEQRGLLVSPAMVRVAVDAHARRHGFHPVRSYLDGLVWDEKPRLDTWLVDYLGARTLEKAVAETAEEKAARVTAEAAYLANVGRMFFISAVARIDRPGVQTDHTLVLEGPQNLGKSNALRILASETFFTDQIREFGSKDAAQQLRGIWIIELSELAAITSTRTELERVKAFLTQRDDRFRVPYGHRPVKFLRSCVFTGTTNQEEYLRDETGNRRFWPVRCTAIDLTKLARDRDQLWAEARTRYKRGEAWHITDPQLLKTAEEQQRDRVVQDPWHERVIELARFDCTTKDKEGKPLRSTSVPAILFALNIPSERQDQANQNRVARILRLEGWQRFQTGPRTAREWRYREGVSKSGKSGDPVNQS